jgi:hypothetical protein
MYQLFFSFYMTQLYRGTQGVKLTKRKSPTKQSFRETLGGHKLS